MAWTISTYAGTYMGGNPSNARTALFELCRAVNERQDAIAQAKTQFYKADGTEAADLVTGDLANIRATGINSYAYLNLERVRLWIVDSVNAGYWTETTGRGTVWTLANLESDIGHTLSSAAERPQDAGYWQALQDALDRLIYARRKFGLVDNSGQTRRQQFGSILSTPTLAWDSMAAASETAPSGVTGQDYIRVGYNISGSSGAYIAASGRTWENKECSAPSVEGTLKAVDWLGNYDVLGAGGESMSISITTDHIAPAATATLTPPNPALDASAITIEAAAAQVDITTTTHVTLERTSSLPASNPFVTVGRFNISFNEYRVYFDIAGELTDQA